MPRPCWCKSAVQCSTNTDHICTVECTVLYSCLAVDNGDLGSIQGHSSEDEDEVKKDGSILRSVIFWLYFMNIKCLKIIFWYI